MFKVTDKRTNGEPWAFNDLYVLDCFEWGARELTAIKVSDSKAVVLTNGSRGSRDTVTLPNDTMVFLVPSELVLLDNNNDK